MTTLLILFSFIIHILSIFAIIILFTKYQSIKQLEQSQKQLLQETEEALSLFMMQMKEENEKFINQLQVSDKKNPLPLRNEVESRQIKEENDDDDLPSHLQTILEQQMDVIEVKEIPRDETTSHDQIIELSKKGYTIEEIAQQLNVGKTEIELFLKFNQKQ
ncbi:DUF6115 domain-containing protein [Aeribacillus kexueae]|uniref:DUF6115 domain-containing protein n=1 Tax=Aeribacillus kexueae TaxID=2078952 RepID=UPI001FAE8BD7|nr:hypothetical protein [Bacillus kexueae]